MLQFFHRIGRANTSMLTKSKIEGCMKTVWNMDPDEPQPGAPLGFARILNILIPIIRSVCPNIRELTLQMEDKVKNRDFKQAMLWDDDPYNNAGKSDEERIDEVVEKVVNSLDSLRLLRLEACQSPQSSGQDADEESVPAFEDEWGRSTRWMKVVKERANR